MTTYKACFVFYLLMSLCVISGTGISADDIEDSVDKAYIEDGQNITIVDAILEEARFGSGKLLDKAAFKSMKSIVVMGGMTTSPEYEMLALKECIASLQYKGSFFRTMGHAELIKKVGHDVVKAYPPKQKDETMSVRLAQEVKRRTGADGFLVIWILDKFDTIVDRAVKVDGKMVNKRHLATVMKFTSTLYNSTDGAPVWCVDWKESYLDPIENPLCPTCGNIEKQPKYSVVAKRCGALIATIISNRYDKLNN